MVLKSQGKCLYIGYHGAGQRCFWLLALSGTQGKIGLHLSFRMLDLDPPNTPPDLYTIRNLTFVPNKLEYHSGQIAEWYSNLSCYCCDSASVL